jgi:hypothetical protein
VFYFAIRNVTSVTVPGSVPRHHSARNLINGCGSQPRKPKENVMTARTALIGTAVVAALLASSATSHAEGTPEQRSACMGDAFKYCSSHIPNVPAIKVCMKANYSKLSTACKAAAAKG